MIGLLFFSFLYFVFSWGFVDPIFLESNPILFQDALFTFSAFFSSHRLLTVSLYGTIIAGLFFWYRRIMQSGRIKKIIVVIGLLFVFSYPALSFDIFNYVLTAKVLYQYHENPYIIAPIEITNEPMLGFTRAINKTALYGPVWLALSAIPHYMGFGSVWATVFSFKILNLLLYLFVCWLIGKHSKKLKQVVFFALNPLVLIEVLGNGHNDIAMMALALIAIILLRKKFVAFVLLVLSVFVKGATLLLVPLLLTNIRKENKILLSFYLMFGLLLFTPIREELYPWYAVWFLPFAALLMPSGRPLQTLSIVVSLTLMLRYVPYMHYGRYDGPVPLLRLIITVVPLSLYALYSLIQYAYRNR